METSPGTEQGGRSIPVTFANILSTPSHGEFLLSTEFSCSTHKEAFQVPFFPDSVLSFSPIPNYG